MPVASEVPRPRRPPRQEISLPSQRADPQQPAAGPLFRVFCPVLPIMLRILDRPSVHSLCLCDAEFSVPPPFQFCVLRSSGFLLFFGGLQGFFLPKKASVSTPECPHFMMPVFFMTQRYCIFTLPSNCSRVFFRGISLLGTGFFELPLRPGDRFDSSPSLASGFEKKPIKRHPQTSPPKMPGLFPTPN